MPTAYAQTQGCTPQALQLAQRQLNTTLGYISTSRFPQLTVPPANHWNANPATDWTSGFFPGWIWYMYEQTLDGSLLTRAKAQTASLAAEATDASGHDIGFRIMSSYGLGYEISRDPTYLSTIQTAAKTMATLYQPVPGVIWSWPNSDNNITVIMDDMMTLELLFYASKNGGDPNWYTMAVNHAYNTMRDNVRSDGSTWQVIDYSHTTGQVVSKYTADGYNNTSNSTWSRGQAWGLYGFTMAYRYTKDPNVLATAEKLADYVVANAPADYVPWWDYARANTSDPRDSSAAAIAAAGFLELSTYMSDPSLQSKYYNAALNIQGSLSNPALYLANPTPSTPTDGVLLHGTYSLPYNVGINTSVIWGDYFFIQSCYRAMAPPAQVTNLTATATFGTQANLAWNAQAGATRYSVKRSATSGGPYAIIAPPPILTANTFTDTGVAPSTTYYYVVSASSIGGEGPDSAEVAVSTPAGTPTDTAAGSSPNPSTYGQAAMLTATVTSAAGTPAGTVAFADGGTMLGSSALNTGGQATFATSSLAAGAHPITAVYSGGGGFAASTSPAVVQMVNKASTSISVSTSVTPSKAGQSVTFKAMILPSTATGTVQFFDGSNSLGAVSLSGGTASLSTSALGNGSHSITTSYGGDGNYNGSTSAPITQTVNVAPASTTTTVGSSANPSEFKNAVTFTVTVKSAAGTPTGTVRFLDGNTIFGTGTLSVSGQTMVTTSGLSIGSHSITAAYVGDGNFAGSTSAVLTQSVKRKLK